MGGDRGDTKHETHKDKKLITNTHKIKHHDKKEQFQLTMCNENEETET